jgi:hypothetical protein
VPLDEDHIARLSHSALALDVYSWLANRLHRIPQNKPAAVSWAALHGQFGQRYKQIQHFRAAFRTALKEVRALYRGARVAEPEKNDKPVRTITEQAEIIVREQPSKGLILYTSPPPVSPR